MAFEYLKVFTGRRIVFDYISPAVCEGEFSSSGTPFISLLPIHRAHAPSGPIMGTNGSQFRFSWDTTFGALCYSVYKAVDEEDPNGDYTLVAECITDTFIDLDDAGWYYVVPITKDGIGLPSSPIHTIAPGGGGGTVPVPQEHWSFEEAAGSRFGDVQSIPLVLGGTDGAITRNLDGVIDAGVRFSDFGPLFDSLVTDTTENLPGLGLGFTVCGWFQPKILTATHFRLFASQRVREELPSQLGFFKLDLEPTQFRLSLTDENANEIFLVVPIAEGFIGPDATKHFFRAWYEPTNKKIRLQIDNGDITVSGDTLEIIGVCPYGTFAVAVGDSVTTTNVDVTVDEYAIWQLPLNDGEAGLLWNHGNGLAFPYPV